MQKNIIVIGHVDHGKTTFLRALDRFINGEPKFDPHAHELSFSVSYNIGEDSYTVFDYGGHHQYMENIGKNDEWAAILICSATDGPMPQTSEQVKLCKERGIERIAVFMTNCDLAYDEDIQDFVLYDIMDILEENGYTGDIPVERGSAQRALDWAKEEDKKLFFGFLQKIHRMK
ncbi:MAG: hypothetical protein IJ306_02805 [Oscillospiraceae bacterium]|nr:hypothetical protein [Oscillospiraceae bacterium]